MINYTIYHSTCIINNCKIEDDKVVGNYIDDM